MCCTNGEPACLYICTWEATSGFGPSSSSRRAKEAAVWKFFSYRRGRKKMKLKDRLEAGGAGF